MITSHRMSPSLRTSLVASTVFALALPSLLAGCTDDSNGRIIPVSGTAEMQAVQGSQITGSATFWEILPDALTDITFVLEDLERDGRYPVRILDTGDCSQIDSASVFNPTNQQAPERVGDLLMFTATLPDDSTEAPETASVARAKITVDAEASSGVAGKVIVVFEKLDPTQAEDPNTPPVDPGTPAACGVIKAEAE